MRSSSFDPYASEEAAPTPGRLSVIHNKKAGRHILRLPCPHESVSARILFLEVTGAGTKTVQLSPGDREVSCEFPADVRVAAFLIDENRRGERTSAGPVLFFWTTEESEQ